MIGARVSAMPFYVGACTTNKITFFRMIIYWIYLPLSRLANWNSLADKASTVDFTGSAGFAGESTNDNWNI